MQGAETFGGLVKRLRRARGWTQERLAEEAGDQITQSAVSQVEHGKGRPQAATVRLLARALGQDELAWLRLTGYAPGHDAPRAVPHDGPPALSTAEMVAFVEANPSQAFRERLARMRGLLRTDAYERLVVKTYLAWLANGDLGLSAAEAVLGPGH